MHDEELSDFLEKERMESTDLYKIAARIKNYVNAETSLTPVGTGLCNAFTHHIKILYDFAESLEENKREELKKLLREQEKVPANIIKVSFKLQKN